MKNFTVALIFALVYLICLSTNSFAQSATNSFASILDADGSIKPGSSGSFDPKGFRLTPGLNGKPRFIHSEQTWPEPEVPAIADACGDNWDDRFGSQGLNGWVLAIAVAPTTGDVYVGGTFSQAGGVPANHIAKWNGLRWSALGSGTNNEIYAIALLGTDVYVGGAFTQAGGVPANRIAKWNGGSWSALGSGMNSNVYALVVTNSPVPLVHAGGDFTAAGGVLANRVAKWDGTAWAPIGVGVGSNLDHAVYALEAESINSSRIYVGGNFPTAGGFAAKNFAVYGAGGWSDLYDDIDGVVEDISYSGGDLSVGGTALKGSANIVYWFVFSGEGSWEASFPTTNNTVYDIETATYTYAGGIFSSPGNRIAGGANTFEGGMPGSGTHVSALGLTTDSLYAGGGFGTAGCRPSGNFGRYFQRRFVGSEFSSDWHDPSLWTTGTYPSPSGSANIGSHDAVIVSGYGAARDLRIDNGRFVSVGATNTLYIFRNLNINDGFINGDGIVEVSAADTNAIYGGGPNGFISATLTRAINNSGTFELPVGSGGLYAGISLSNITGSDNFSVKANSGAVPPTPGLPANRLQRSWNITDGASLNASLTFRYNQSEVVGNETAYKLFRINGSTATQVATVIDTVNNTATVTGFVNTGVWTLADTSGPPEVTTLAPAFIEHTQAFLSAQIDPNGYATSLWWRYSTVNPGTCNGSFGQETAHFDVGSGLDPFAFSRAAGGLSPGTTYYYCAIALNSAGSVFGSIVSFTTLAGSAPSASTNQPAQVGPTSAMLRGGAIPNGVAATGWFRYSTSNPGACNDTFGTRAPATGGFALGSGSGPPGFVSFSQPITGLIPSTTYYYCAIASNSVGTSFGSVVSFVTAPVLVVDNVTDNAGLTACTAAANDCSLRGAVAVAPAGAEIHFLLPLFGAARTISLLGSPIVVTRNIAIVGPGSNLLTVSGASMPAVMFEVGMDFASEQAVLNIIGVRIFGAQAGAVLVNESSSGESHVLIASLMLFEGNNGLDGGAVTVESNSQATFINSTFSNNESAGFFDGGDAIDATAFGTMVTIRGCTFAQNTGFNTTVAVNASTIENSTIDLNTGSGLRLGGPSTITGSTITGNGRGGISAIGTATIRNSIVALNTTSDVAGNFISQGYNLIGRPGSITAFNQPGDQAGTAAAHLNPRLQGLAANGGPTETRAPLPDSPTIDKGNSFGLTTDQRGSLRPVDFFDATYPNAPGGNGADIGAHEVQGGPTAANVSVSGRVSTPFGNGIRGAAITLSGGTLDTPVTVLTGSFGYYRFENVPSGHVYVVSIAGRRHVFEQSTRIISVMDEITDLDFISSPGGFNGVSMSETPLNPFLQLRNDR